MKKNKIIKLFLISLVLIWIILNITVVISCSKNEKKNSVYSVEVLFNNENYSDFKAEVNESFYIGISVNDYKEDFKFQLFYACIDYNNEKIKLNYGKNEVKIGVPGSYEVKVTIIDDFQCLRTKRMPFCINEEQSQQEPTKDTQPPEILGKINEISAYPKIGCILPEFEVIDDSGEEIEPEFTAQNGQIIFNSEYDFYYYINDFEQDDTDTITLKAQDSAGNYTQINIAVEQIDFNESYWFFYVKDDFQILDGDFIALDKNKLYFKGITSKKYSIAYNDIDDITINIDFNKYAQDSYFNLSFEEGNFKQHEIKFDFNNQKIRIGDNYLDFLDSITLSFDKANNRIIISNSKDEKFINIESLAAVIFEMNMISFSAIIK